MLNKGNFNVYLGASTSRSGLGHLQLSKWPTSGPLGTSRPGFLNSMNSIHRVLSWPLLLSYVCVWVLIILTLRLEKAPVVYSGGLRDDCTGHHSFTFMSRKGVCIWKNKILFNLIQSCRYLKVMMLIFGILSSSWPGRCAPQRPNHKVWARGKWCWAWAWCYLPAEEICKWQCFVTGLHWRNTASRFFHTRS